MILCGLVHSLVNILLLVLLDGLVRVVVVTLAKNFVVIVVSASALVVELFGS